MSKRQRLREALTSCLGWYEAFRRLGFLPSEVHIGQDMDRSTAFVCVRSGGLEFEVEAVTVPDVTRKEFDDAWRERASAWNERMTDTVREAIYSQWLSKGVAQTLVAGLERKGFDLRALASRPEWANKEAPTARNDFATPPMGRA